MLLMLTMLFGIAATVQAQDVPPARAATLYDIAYNGLPVTIDADLSDWADAQWIFLSQDKVNFLQDNGMPIQGVPESPADFSGYIAMKMDDENVYFAAKVRDEGTPMIGTPDTPNLAFNYDHLTMYLGLYDIGDQAGSPHQEGPGEFEFYDPVTEDTIQAGRTYRIAPGVDNTTTTLGADYQLLFRAVDYGGVVEGDAARQFNYSGALVDTTIGGTMGATALFDDETGYVMEWKVPFASLAGQIAKPTREYANFVWPEFEPADGKVIVFDADLTDDDEGDEGLNHFLRVGNQPSLWRDSKSFSMRGRIIDLDLHPYAVPATKYYIDYEADQQVTIDADLSDWMDAPWIGLSQDKVNFLQDNGMPIQGVPESPADFSGYIAMKMDDENVYFAAKVRDEGTPMIGTPDTPNLAFNYDHLTMYLGLYDIGDQAGSPHQEGPGEFEFYDPVTEDTIQAGRTYRIAPGVDNTTTTLGADYQLLFRAVDYGGVVEGDAARQFNYSGALVDTTIGGTMGATALFDDETGYVMEWKVPFASLAGQIAKPTREYANFVWPEFEPADGKVIVFDADLTDDDEGDEGLNHFLRVGNQPSLWRDSKSFSMRGEIVAGGTPQGVFIEDDPTAEVPARYLLQQNYPNPFNPVTTIAFALPEAAPVRLTVYNALGQEVAVLVDGVVTAGQKTVTFDAGTLPSGVYLYRLETPTHVEARRMVLLK